MKTILKHRRTLAISASSFRAGLALLKTTAVFAQEVPGGEALGACLVLVFLVLFVPYYVYWALATQVIARKTNSKNGWLAWIPIGNFVLWASIARKPAWWGPLCIVPIAGMVFMALLWLAIAEARHKPNWWRILSIVPVVNLIVTGYVAWSD